MKSLHFLLVCITLFFMGSVSAVAQKASDKVKLQLHLEKGKSYDVYLLVEIKMSQTVQGQKMDISQTIGYKYLYQVESVEPDGTTLLKVTNNGILYKMDGPTGKKEYDSEKSIDKGDPLAISLSAFLGESYSIKLSPDGTVKGILGKDIMVENIKKKIDIPEGPEKEAAIKNLENQYDHLEDNVKEMFKVYPNTPVSIGDSWTKTMHLFNNFPMIVNSTFTLIDRKNGVAVIDVRSSIKTDPEAEPISLGKVQQKPELSGEEKGKVEIDEVSGWVVRNRSTSQISGTLKMLGIPQMPEGMIIPITMEAIASINSIK